MIVTYVNQGSSLFNHTKEVATEKELNYVSEALLTVIIVLVLCMFYGVL